MSKEQINYLLVLATLLIVWLFFNTFYANVKKSYGVGPFGRVMPASAMKLPNLPEMPKAPKLQNPLAGMTQRSGGMAGSGNMASMPAETPNIPLPLVPASEEKK